MSTEHRIRLDTVAWTLNVQHSNLRTMIGRWLERGDMNPEHVSPTTYPGAKRGRFAGQPIPSYMIGRPGLERVRDLSWNMEPGTSRRAKMDTLIDTWNIADEPLPKPSITKPSAIKPPARERHDGIEVVEAAVFEPTVAPAEMDDLTVRVESKALEPIIQVIEGVAMADSRDVARYFQREHKHVLRSIDSLIQDGPPKDPYVFNELRYFNQTVQKELRYVLMNRTAFTLLAMTLEGHRALRFKKDYIERFERMESELRQRDVTSMESIIENPMQALTLIQGLLGRRIEDQATIDAQRIEMSARDETITDMRPKAEALDRMSKLHGARQIRLVAQGLRIKQNTLVAWLIDQRWIARDSGNRGELICAYKGIQGGYVIPHNAPFYNPKTGQTEISTRPRITAKGEAQIALKVEPDHPAYIKQHLARVLGQGALDV